MDGTDEASEGNWKLTSTNEQPYLPFTSGENSRNNAKNCLDFKSIDDLYVRPCDIFFNGSVICESECKLPKDLQT